MRSTAASLFVRIGVGVKEFERGMGDASRVMENAGRRMTSAGRGLSLGVTAPLVGIGGAAVYASTKFSKGMAEIATLIPGQRDRINELGDSVKRLAIDVGKSTGDLTKGLYATISAIGDTADTMAILGINARAATAGLATTQDALNLTTAVTRSYGDTTARAFRQASDLAFVAVRLGQTTFPELAHSIQRVTPVAAELRVEQEELFAAFAALTGVSGDTAMVATQLQGALNSLIKPSAEMQEAFKRLGVSGARALIELHGFQGGIDALIRTTDGSQESIGRLFGNVRALSGVFALAGSQADSYRAKLEAMRGAAGATDQAFGEMTGGVNKFGFALDKIKARLEVLRIDLGEKIAPVLLELFEEGLVPFIGKLEGLVVAFGNMSEGSRKFIIQAGLIAAALGPALVGLGSFLWSLRQVIGTFPLVKAVGGVALGFLGTVLAGLASTAGLVVVAIAGIGAALYYFRGEIKDALGSALQWVTDKWSAITDRLAEPVERARAAVVGALDKITTAYQRMTDAVNSQIERLQRIQDRYVGWVRDWGRRIIDPLQRAADRIGVPTARIDRVLGRTGRHAQQVMGDLFSYPERVTRRAWTLAGGVVGAFRNMRSGVDGASKDIRRSVEEVAAALPDLVPDYAARAKEEIQRLNELAGEAAVGFGQSFAAMEQAAVRHISGMRIKIEPEVLGLVDSIKHAGDLIRASFVRSVTDMGSQSARAFEDMVWMFRQWRLDFEDAIVGALQTGKWCFKQFVTDVIADIMRLLTRWLVVEPIFQRMAGILSSLRLGGSGAAKAPSLQPTGAPSVPLTTPAPAPAGLEWAPPAAMTAAPLQVIVNDHRPAGSPDLDIDTKVAAGGQKQLVITIAGAVRAGLAQGIFDHDMGRYYGLSRKGA